MVSIAIVGIGCRLPGARNKEEFWQSLIEGCDQISEVPKDRWNNEIIYDPQPATSGRTNTKWGGFVDGVDLFDASFFGISPKEAERMDPQQRFVLETAWESLEDGFIDPRSLSGSNTGVILGMGNYDYGRMLSKDLEQINAYDGTGNTLCIAANRLSYFLNLRGPSLVVESACSSSLVAVHYACKSLTAGESNLCLAGGVSLMLSPEPTITYSQARMMSPTGRCHTFDAAADGYVRGEGCVILVLKRLRDAVTDGDNIHAVIKGSAINQDGKSNGLTAPNGLAQQEVIRAALEDSGLEARDISYVEAHGTGTPLGDPLEMEALEATYGLDPANEPPCFVGSVKTNIGHLEAAAGASGLAKVALMVKHGWIPKSLHLHKLNPYIDLSNSRLRISNKTTPWEETGRLRSAAVSSFGFGGTNVHMIVQEAENKSGDSTIESGTIRSRPFHILALSAPSREGLHRVTASYASDESLWKEKNLSDVCGTAARGRSHFGYRMAIIGNSISEVCSELQSKIKSLPLQTRQSGKKSKLVFLFTGQGSQYEGMGRELLQSESVFREELERCSAILKGRVDPEILRLISGLSEKQGRDILDQTQFTQPVLFSLEYALAKQWLSWGAKPDLLVGHSLGEFVAATIADVMDLEDALYLVAERGRLIQSLPTGGVMYAVQESLRRLQQLIESLKANVSVATVNGSLSCVLSGPDSEMKPVLEELNKEGALVHQLPVSHAFHSEMMREILPEFHKAASRIRYRSAKLPIFSNLTGTLYRGSDGDSSYWCRHLLESVRFDLAIEYISTMGPATCLEVGPKPTLVSLVKKELSEQTSEIRYISSLSPSTNDVRQMLASLGDLYSSGASIDWSSVYPDQTFQRVSLPAYPFEKKRYWAECAIHPLVQTSSPGTNHQGLHGSESRTADQNLVIQQLEELRESSRHDQKLKASIETVIDAIKTFSHEMHSNGQKPTIEGARVDWIPLPRALHSDGDSCARDWIILSETKSVGEHIRRVLEQKGQHCRHCLLGNVDEFDRVLNIEETGNNERDSSPLDILVVINVTDTESGFIHDRDNLDSPVQQTGDRLCSILDIIRKVNLYLGNSTIRYWFLTSHGVRVADEEIVDPSVQAIWGFVKVFGLEEPQRLQAIIDVPSGLDKSRKEHIVSEVLLRNPEDSLLAIRGSDLLSPRLRPVGYDSQSSSEILLDGTYLITGGHGSLGLFIAAWLAEEGVKNIILLGRSQPSPEVVRRIQKIQTRNTKIRSVVLDVCNRQEVCELVNELSRSASPLLGVFHCAGTTSYHEIHSMNEHDLLATLKSKVEGGWNLHLATKELDLSYFVMFSSIASVWGSRGQAHYAAANAFLDGLCQMRQALGQPALSVNWGPWEGSTMVKPEYQEVLGKMGIEPIDEKNGIGSLKKWMGTTLPDITLARVDWHRFTPLYESKAHTHLLSEMPTRQDEKESHGSDQLSPISTATNITLLLAKSEKKEREQMCIEMLKEILIPLLGFASNEELDIDANLFDIGVDSLIAMDIISSLRSRFGKEVALLDLTEANSVRSLAGLVLGSLGYESTSTIPHQKLDLHKEARLPVDLKRGAAEPLAWMEPKKILLIGATGFLGAYLVRDLIHNTNAIIYCIVRLRNDSDGLSRVKENLMIYGLWDEAFSSRLVVFGGDISQPKMGLDDETYSSLIEQIDTVFHSAAVLNFVLPYERLRGNNVQGTLEVIRFAIEGKPKILHYVSTDAVYDADEYYECTVPEDLVPTATDGIELGYTQTKWVSERLVDSARQLGLNASIYRPPLISGDTEQGRWNTEDFTSLFIKGCIQMRAIPDIDAKITFVPVDFVSHAIVRLALDKSSLGGNYHLTNPNDTTWADITSWLNTFGYEVRTVSYDVWERMLIAESASSTNVLAPLLPFFLRRWSRNKYNFAELAEHRVRLGTAKTSECLERSQIQCPTISQSLMRTYISYFRSCGFLPQHT